jgi:tetratricopeptide (TPR) repeat protein
MMLGPVALTLAALAGAFYWWQTSLAKSWKALLKRGREAQESGRLPDAEKALLHAVACARRTWIRCGDALVVTQHALAMFYYEQGKFEQAEQTAAKAFAALRKLPRGSRVTTQLICLMAQIYKRLGKDLSAGPIFQVAIQLLRRTHGDRSLAVGAALHELGVTLTRVGVPERAIEVLKESIPILEERLGKEHGDIAGALTNLGKAQSETEHYAESEQSYRRAIAIREAAGGPDNPEVALLLNNLAVNFKRQKRISEALECLDRALAIREAKLGPNHPNVALVLNNLANCLRLEKRYDEAEMAVSRALTILENPPHKSLTTVLDSFGSLRAAQGRYEEAEQFFARCLKLHESRPSSSMLELAETCERYADVLYKLQKEKQGDALMEQVGKLREARGKLLTPAAPLG